MADRRRGDRRGIHQAIGETLDEAEHDLDFDNTEFQVEIQIKESRAGFPLLVGKRYTATLWVEATSLDRPGEVLRVAANCVGSQQTWKGGAQSGTAAGEP